eukprot:TRINITY_DN11541_c0_g1_i1.p1 TRINITY_DN11541_c0_g1~~TRINITY_DN11541_c0_g1_i1.p1  ORF type:complete len:321 (+),score=39.65 TRINITY_DN11541_c0_g1_i1:89-1051(+)
MELLDLTDDCLTYIIGLFSYSVQRRTIAPVCTRLWELVKETIAVLDLRDQRFTSQFVPRLPFLLTFRTHSINNNGVKMLAQGARDLLVLDIAQCNIVTDIAMYHVADNCRKLRTLNLRGCMRLTDAGILAVARTCLQLESVDVGRCYSLTDASVFALVQHCPRLHFVVIKHTKVTAAGVQALVTITELKHLDLNCLSIENTLPVDIFAKLIHLCSLCVRQLPITDEHVASIVNASRQLQRLNLTLTGCTYGVLPIIAALPHLERLAFSVRVASTDNWWMPLMSCTKLRRLTASEPPKTLRAIVAVKVSRPWSEYSMGQSP